MKKLFVILSAALLFNVSTELLAQSDKVVTVTSPKHRVALLELYTSEGCSSCPPADALLNRLQASGISDRKIIPLAFHVTYWDYIGWQDRFARQSFDTRQRDLARQAKQKTVYTPQFVLAGKDFRRTSRLNDAINNIIDESAEVTLALSVSRQADVLELRLTSELVTPQQDEIGLYLAVVENNLSSEVNAGENEGEQLQHNYVVRQLSSPYYQSQSEKHLAREQKIVLRDEWKRADLSIVAFAQNVNTGEILQAVKYNYRDDLE